MQMLLKLTNETKYEISDFRRVYGMEHFRYRGQWYQKESDHGAKMCSVTPTRHVMQLFNAALIPFSGHEKVGVIYYRGE